MSIQAVLLPLFVQVMLTFVLLCWMAYLRTDAFKTRRGERRGYRLARAELAAAAEPDRQRLSQSVRSCRFSSTC